MAGTGNREQGTAKRSFFWRLVGINLIVIAVAVAIVALAIGQLADSIFSSLMKQFHIQTDVLHGLFVRSLTQSLLLASLLAGGVGILLSVILFRRVTNPLRGMIAMTERIAGGDYTARVPVTTSDELASLAQALNRMADALATLDRLRKDLVANVAHELRTPLTNLRGYLEAMAEGVTSPTAEAIASLHDEVMRLVRLVDALHQLSLFDARLSELAARDVDVGALVRRLVDLRRTEFASRGIAVRGMPEGSPVHADPDLVAQAVSNLLDNALKYTPSGGDVTVVVRRADGAVRVEVTNTGDGLAPADLPFVFERFYRGEKSRSRESGGAGIGLAIVRAVATAHGGEVGARSEAGTTTIWFSLRDRTNGGGTGHA
ncbi:MAG TPA: ATP-binding protein [bacterium]|jgi:signal transduction histidine kinase|nr:ATP-binding protein [bacterium]